ncbi:MULTISPECIES: endonuclease/exonuclease/phosphatase family protein [Micromonospora]|uniref:Endonuclease n=1 Tax=Micromonospora maris TaxID=1003110 RepID=A0A9X0I2S3_9ACTN|nr:MULTISPECIES: endonuclease/exonuclease/phosphatase family protein [Micromonospora]AEB46493.1 endonuclease/exonuclease/phosphatase [Micromonospora maris AB-18-032]KUJ45710.1 endonuclease [Micromonospora maris]RUL94224.1 endonuclease [Verrucosispora sp. FIM060022]
MADASCGVPLRVVSYNVHGQRDDVAALATVVRQLAPDVLIVQEGPRRFGWRAKSATLAASFGLVVAAGGLPALGNLLLVSLRVRVTGVRHQRFPLTPGRHMRGAAYADCVVGGPARFTVAGSHLATDPVERPDQAKLFKRELDVAPLPVIAAADLNEEPDGPAWCTVAHGLTDAAVAADRADRLTYSCADPRRRIDGVFVDPRITVVDYDVLDTPLSRRASDHFPIVVDLLLPVAD